jgi:nucleoside-diphosphate-sugar epimerase
MKPEPIAFWRNPQDEAPEAGVRDNLQMRVLVLGATGALGSHLMPQLVSQGYQVSGTTRSPERARRLNETGVNGIVVDALDREALIAAVRSTAPDVLIHQLTAIPPRLNMRHFDREFQNTSRLRTEGTDNVLAAARASGVGRIIAQSFAGWSYAREGGPIKTEQDRFDPSPPRAFRRTLHAIEYLERSLLGQSDIEPIVLRYGAFYGPQTSLGRGGTHIDDVLRRRFPLVGNGGGRWSFLHIADAAAATLAAVQRGAPGVYNIVDDEPAAVAQWLPALARAVGAPPPRRVPAWLVRIIGEHAVTLMTENRGASNAKARRELIWAPRYSSWRQGFITGLG